MYIHEALEVEASPIHVVALDADERAARAAELLAERCGATVTVRCANASTSIEDLFYSCSSYPMNNLSTKFL